jgi:hypothetical protein
MIPMNEFPDDSGYPKRVVFQYFSDQLRRRWYVIEHGVDLLTPGISSDIGEVWGASKEAP